MTAKTLATTDHPSGRRPPRNTYVTEKNSDRDHLLGRRSPTRAHSAVVARSFFFSSFFSFFFFFFSRLAHSFSRRVTLPIIRRPAAGRNRERSGIPQVGTVRGSRLRSRDQLPRIRPTSGGFARRSDFAATTTTGIATTEDEADALPWRDLTATRGNVDRTRVSRATVTDRSTRPAIVSRGTVFLLFFSLLSRIYIRRGDIRKQTGAILLSVAIASGTDRNGATDTAQLVARVALA